MSHPPPAAGAEPELERERAGPDDRRDLGSIPASRGREESSQWMLLKPGLRQVLSSKPHGLGFVGSPDGRQWGVRAPGKPGEVEGGFSASLWPEGQQEARRLPASRLGVRGAAGAWDLERPPCSSRQPEHRKGEQKRRLASLSRPCLSATAPRLVVREAQAPSDRCPAQDGCAGHMPRGPVLSPPSNQLGLSCPLWTSGVQPTCRRPPAGHPPLAPG